MLCSVQMWNNLELATVRFRLNQFVPVQTKPIKSSQVWEFSNLNQTGLAQNGLVRLQSSQTEPKSVKDVEAWT